GFADESVRIGTERVDGPAGGESESVSFDIAFLIDDDLAEVLGGFMQDVSPTFAVIEVQPGGEFVAGRHPDVIAGAAGSLFDRVEGIGIGDADLARFLHDLETGAIVDPGGLIWEETEHIY